MVDRFHSAEHDEKLRREIEKSRRDICGYQGPQGVSPTGPPGIQGPPSVQGPPAVRVPRDPGLAVFRMTLPGGWEFDVDGNGRHVLWRRRQEPSLPPLADCVITRDPRPDPYPPQFGPSPDDLDRMRQWVAVDNQRLMVERRVRETRERHRKLFAYRALASIGIGCWLAVIGKIIWVGFWRTGPPAVIDVTYECCVVTALIVIGYCLVRAKHRILALKLGGGLFGVITGLIIWLGILLGLYDPAGESRPVNDQTILTDWIAANRMEEAPPAPAPRGPGRRMQLGTKPVTPQPPARAHVIIERPDGLEERRYLDE